MMACVASVDGLDQGRMRKADESGSRNGALDMERRLLATLSQLDSRVRLLEGQGQRADRQAIEVAKLVQEMKSDRGQLPSIIERMSRLEDIIEKEDDDGVVRRLDAAEARVAALAESTEDLQLQLSAAQDRWPGEGHLQALAECQESQQAALRAVEELGARMQRLEAEGLGAAGRSPARDHGTVGVSEFLELRQRVKEMQVSMDERVMVWVWNTERQLPEAMDKLTRLADDSAETFAKFEEQGVRLSLAMAKLGANEQRVQSYADRVERLPSATELRSVCRDEVRRKMEDANLEGLQRRISLLSDSVDDLGARQRSREPASPLGARQ